MAWVICRMKMLLGLTASSDFEALWFSSWRVFISFRWGVVRGVLMGISYFHLGVLALVHFMLVGYFFRS